MKTGDKKQAVLLSLVAVGAIGFLARQLMPAKLITLGGATAPAAAAPAPQDFAERLPLTLVGNPFSHPMLAPKPVVIGGANTPPASDIDKGGVLHPLTWAGNNTGESDTQLGGGSLVGADNNTGESGTQPADSAGRDRQKDQDLVIRVTAVMSVGKPTAFLEINGHEAQAFSEGDLLTKGVQLVKIGDSTVTVRIHGVKNEISAGESYGSAAKENQG